MQYYRRENECKTKNFLFVCLFVCWRADLHVSFLPAGRYFWLCARVTGRAMFLLTYNMHVSFLFCCFKPKLIAKVISRAVVVIKSMR